MPRLALRNVLCLLLSSRTPCGREAALDSMTLRSTTEYVKPWFPGMACLRRAKRPTFDYFEISLVEHDPCLHGLQRTQNGAPRSDDAFGNAACVPKTLLLGGEWEW